MQTEKEVPKAYGVFKPVGHVVVSFPTPQDTDAAESALRAEGFKEIDRYAPEQMKAQVDAHEKEAGILASLGQELNLVKAHRELAEKGYSWLVVKAENDEAAQRIADLSKAHKAERAQHYGRLVIEELIQHGDELPQVSESPARGLDAQTPSGEEQER
jgi:hypothetical protein